MSPSFWRYMKYARPYWPLCVVSIVCGVIKFSLALLLPYSLGKVVKDVFQSELTADEMSKSLSFTLGLLIVGFVLRFPITYLRTYYAELAGNRTIFDVRTDLYRHIQRLSIAYHANRRTGVTISRLINDINAAQGILDRGVITLIIDFLFLIGVVTLLVLIDWRLACASLVTLPLYCVAIIVLNPKMRETAADVQEQVSEMSGEVTEKLAGLSVVHAFVREKTEELHFFKRHREYFSKVMTKTRIQSVQMAATEFLTAAGPLVVIGYGGYRVMQDPLFVEEFIWFYGFISHLYLPTRRLADSSMLVQERLAGMDRVFEVFDEEPDIQDAQGAKRLLLPQGQIDFKNVSFGYYAETPVLHDVTFSVQPGESVAFVGRSGAGKSTLINLVPRFYDIDSGEICVDGTNIKNLQIKSLREHIGMVLQDSILFSGTIRENILYGKRNAAEAEMLRAAQMAHVDEFVNELPEMYETLIGERGVKLSGGQKQRISIARAFLRDPRILILDEATSSLDSHAENVIQEALADLMEGRTTLVIAHRLSTIVDCDRVIVLEDGRIVQSGTHDSLIRIEGPYQALCAEQFGYVRLEQLDEDPA